MEGNRNTPGAELGLQRGVAALPPGGNLAGLRPDKLWTGSRGVGWGGGRVGASLPAGGEGV